MTSSRSCYVFGGDSLLIECVQMLKNRGFEVLGVVSRSAQIEAWANQNSTRFIGLDTEYVERLVGAPSDYIFSITHLEIIPQRVLDVARVLCINFHDGPLPRYAGLNAPAWAIINGEREYGITWHQLTAGVDEGDILLQKEFEVSHDETALSLNTKCFAAALESFPVLLDQICNGKLDPTPQDQSQRSYFGKFDRLPAAGIIDWSHSAVSIAAHIRATEFGGYPNPLGVMKLHANDRTFVVEAAIPLQQNSAPGEIVGIEDGQLEVGTGDGVLAVSTLRTVTGEGVSIRDAAAQMGVKEGDKLGTPGADTATPLSGVDEVLCRSEAFWASRLGNLMPVGIPGLNLQQQVVDGPNYGEIPLDTLPLDRGRSDTTVQSLTAAFTLLWARICDQVTFDLSFSPASMRKQYAGLESIVSPWVPLHLDLTGVEDVGSYRQLISAELELVGDHDTWLKDLVFRMPDVRSTFQANGEVPLPVGIATETTDAPYMPADGTLLGLVIDQDKLTSRLVFDRNRLGDDVVGRLGQQYQSVLSSIAANPQGAIGDVRLLSDEMLQRVLYEWNGTQREFPENLCVHQAFEAQVDRTPDNVALIFQDQRLTYRELDARANRLAERLVEQGVGPDMLVGVYVDRSLDLMVSTLGVLKAGGAYVPLDPAFPEQRIGYMIGDAAITVILAQQHTAEKLSAHDSTVIIVDDPAFEALPCPDSAPASNVTADNLAYVIYTSGSTGLPKGVMVEHRNVINFFTGMDQEVPHDPPGTWLAVTSLSFDISVLELFWTLTRGFEVVIYKDPDRDTESAAAVPESVRRRPMGFGLFMWGNDDAPGRDKYRLMLEGARYFDDNGFDAVWTPERHFSAFGGPYPNPAVTGAALAAITRNLSIRAGSCVSPLHHPIRIAEDWAVIDNLSNGRAGLSFASGWQPNDFVIKPENHKHNKSIMVEQIGTVRKLWRGEKVPFENPMGDMVDIVTLPRPVQKELPVWVTTAGNPETYKQAGISGANVLTHLLGQTVDELAEKIRLYREARMEAGHDPDSGKVTLMLHTFVGEDNDTVRELVREPMKDYLRSAMKLVIDFAWSFPAFKRPGGTASKVEDIDIGSLSEEETGTILDFAFERYFENSGLFGTPETCINMVNRCKQADIDEIACLLDFGAATEEILASLPCLKQVRDATNEIAVTTDGYDFNRQVDKYSVTHLQCTPSMARMLTLNPDTRDALATIRHLMVGGEALSATLATQLAGMESSSVTNMYGPTETTIWSTTQSIDKDMPLVPIGKPVANTQIYILDRYRQPVPPGVPGDLFIGGKGVARGYLNRPELTAERFIRNPFSDGEHDRIYRTGDLASYRDDGTIDFLGRSDHQIKIRGYRIELGEIESALEQQEQIRESVVVLREDSPGDQRLVAYSVAQGDPPSSKVLRSTLGKSLPDYMIPGDFVMLDKLPLTPNGKIDRQALPNPSEVTVDRNNEYVAPESDLEQKIVGLWQNVLQVKRVGTNDNFFDLGGHSLLIVKLHAEFRKLLDQPVSLTDLYRFPTISSLVEHLNSDGASESLKESASRAKRRREMVRKRRKRG